MSKTEQIQKGSDLTTKIQARNDWSYAVRDNYDEYQKAVLELQKKHNAIYQKIQDKAESKLGRRIGRDVKDEEF